MTIQRKIEKSPVVNPEESKSVSKKQKTWTNLCLRVTTDIVKHIDCLLEERLGISRTAWILEAIQEKLRKDSKSSN